MQGWIEMGGYGAFVWPSYALVAVVMAGLVITTLKTLRERQSVLRRLDAERPQRRRRGAPGGETQGTKADQG